MSENRKPDWHKRAAQTYQEAGGLRPAAARLGVSHTMLRRVLLRDFPHIVLRRRGGQHRK